MVSTASHPPPDDVPFASVLSYAAPTESPGPYPVTTRVMALLGWALLGTATALIPLVDIETILVTGPAIAVVGSATLALGIAGRRTWAWALGGVLMGLPCAVFGLIALNHWGPRQASGPVLVIASFATVALAVPTYLAVRSTMGRPSAMPLADAASHPGVTIAETV